MKDEPKHEFAGHLAKVTIGDWTVTLLVADDGHLCLDVSHPSGADTHWADIDVSRTMVVTSDQPSLREVEEEVAALVASIQPPLNARVKRMMARIPAWAALLDADPEFANRTLSMVLGSQKEGGGGYVHHEVARRVVLAAVEADRQLAQPSVPAEDWPSD